MGAAGARRRARRAPRECLSAVGGGPGRGRPCRDGALRRRSAVHPRLHPLLRRLGAGRLAGVDGGAGGGRPDPLVRDRVRQRAGVRDRLGMGDQPGRAGAGRGGLLLAGARARARSGHRRGRAVRTGVDRPLVLALGTARRVGHPIGAGNGVRFRFLRRRFDPDELPALPRGDPRRHGAQHAALRLPRPTRPAARLAAAGGHAPPHRRRSRCPSRSGAGAPGGRPLRNPRRG